MNNSILELLKSKDFYELEQLYSRNTILDIFNISRRELSHSSFIAWVLNPKQSHGLGEYPLRRLIELCYDSLDDKLKNIVYSNYEISNVNVEREKSIDNDKSRLDLYITFRVQTDSELLNVHIIIENKIDSEEHDNQTDKYSKWLTSICSSKDIPLMIYLSPTDSRENTNNGFCYLSYEDFSNKLLHNCLYRINDSFNKAIVSDYICSLSKSETILQSNDKELAYNIIASSDDEKVLIQKLIDNYSQVLENIVKDKAITNKYKVYNNKKVVFDGIFNYWSNVTNNKQLQRYISIVLNNNKISIKYRDKTYKKYGHNGSSLGYLAHDLVANYAKEHNTASYSVFNRLLNEDNWEYNYNRKYTIANQKQLEGLKASGYDIKDHFFIDENDEIICNKDKEKIYVFKYFTANDVIKLANILKETIEVI